MLLDICYQFCTFKKNPIFSTHFLLGSEITGLTALSPFGLSFFFHQVSCVSSVTLLYSTQLCEFLCVPDGGRTLRELITGWICLSPFHSLLLSSWPPLSPSSPFSSMYNSVNISERSSCGVHIRKWFLVSPLSPLLIPPHLIWVTSNSLLPLLFSM